MTTLAAGPESGLVTALAIAEACRPGNVTAVYQPLVRLADEQAVGFEALGRVTEDREWGEAVHAAELLGFRQAAGRPPLCGSRISSVR